MPEFDYIICGGGTSGCALAGRLAMSERADILVIEAGPHSEDLESVHMPGGWTDLIDSTFDWRFTNSKGGSSTSSAINLTRGKLLGGSSAINGTACVRGSPQDFDDWDLPGWDGKSMFEYMAKAETFHAKNWFEAAREYHGYDGPIHTEPHDIAPISRLLLQSFKAAEFPRDDDLFTRGDKSQGVGYATRSHWRGRRSTSADYLTREECKNGLTVWTNCTIDRVDFTIHDGKWIAHSVSYFDEQKNRHSVGARKEIILSAGTYGSPAILLRSGCGPKEQLDRLGIPCKLDLPGVGENLQDHLIVFMFYETDVPGLTLDSSMHHDDDGKQKAHSAWRTDRSGTLASIPFGICAFTRLDAALERQPLWTAASRLPGRDPMGLTEKQPHVEYFTTECCSGLKEFQIITEDTKHIFGIVPVLFAPQSRGTISLHSADPFAAPCIQHNYLSHELDVIVLAEACKLANDIVVHKSPTRDLVRDSWPTDSRHHLLDSSEQWQDFVKAHATTCFHAAGTCKMGHDEDPLAVLDSKLYVRGTANLRVVDCSVMPKLNGGHTQMPAYAIGEKAADLIRTASVSQ